MKQITANVYVEDQFSVPPKARGCNRSFVTTSEGIVMIDSPMLPTDAVQWRNEIATRGELRYIINTGYHADHISGNYFFSGTVISHEGTREMFSAPVEDMIAFPEGIKVALEIGQGIKGYIINRFKESDPEGIALADNYQLRPPDITFSQQLDLYLGDHTFKLIHLPGHTPYEVSVYVPQERIVFTGDNVTNGSQPSLAHSCPVEWLESLKKIEAMDVDVVVPGHGEVGDKRIVPEGTQFIQECIDVVRKAINQGMSKEEAADRVSFEEVRAAVHPGPGQQRMNIIRLYEMLSK
ncbi:MBL fold metallo-hydrolase [Chloroflexota bacterium]